MSTCINRLMIPRIIIWALLVAALSTFAMAFQPSDTSTAYKPGDVTGPKDTGAMGKPGGLARPGVGAPLAVPLDQCYASCRTEESGITRYLCSVGCGYSTEFPPLQP